MKYLMATLFYFKLFCCSLTSKQRHKKFAEIKPKVKTTKVLQMRFLTRYFFRSLLFCRLDLYHATEWLEDWMKIVLIAQNGSKSITTEKWVFFWRFFFFQNFMSYIDLVLSRHCRQNNFEMKIVIFATKRWGQ